MGTHASISYKDSDGFIHGIYCHYDGYPDYMAYILTEHYNSFEAAQKLVALGDCGSIGETLEECTPYSKWQKWDEVKPKIDDCYPTYLRSLEGYGPGEYAYLFTSGNWIFAPTDYHMKNVEWSFCTSYVEEREARIQRKAKKVQKAMDKNMDEIEKLELIIQREKGFTDDSVFEKLARLSDLYEEWFLGSAYLFMQEYKKWTGRDLRVEKSKEKTIPKEYVYDGRTFILQSYRIFNEENETGIVMYGEGMDSLIVETEKGDGENPNFSNARVFDSYFKALDYYKERGREMAEKEGKEWKPIC